MTLTAMLAAIAAWLTIAAGLILLAGWLLWRAIRRWLEP